MKEIELAEKIIEYLENDDWEIYQEVEHDYHIADVVAVKDEKVWIIEVKTSLTKKLLSQAYYWIFSADYVSIATINSNRDRRDKYKFLNKNGIGCILFDKDNNQIKEYIKYKQQEENRLLRPIKDSLLPQHKYWAKAGNEEGKRYTVFQETLIKLEEVVNKYPGLMLTDLLRRVDTHYATKSSAASSLKKLQNLGVLKTIEIIETNGYFRVYLKDKED